MYSLVFTESIQYDEYFEKLYPIVKISDTELFTYYDYNETAVIPLKLIINGKIFKFFEKIILLLTFFLLKTRYMVYKLI